MELVKKSGAIDLLYIIEKDALHSKKPYIVAEVVAFIAPAETL